MKMTLRALFAVTAMVLVGIFFGGTAGAELPPQEVQSDSPYCSDNYVSHCIPTNIGDVDCDRFGGFGYEHVVVIGVDEFFLDADGDGIGCTTADAIYLLNLSRSQFGLPPVEFTVTDVEEARAAQAAPSAPAAAAAPVSAPAAAPAAAAPTALAVTGAEDMPIAIVGVTLVLAGFMVAGFVRRETASA